MSRDGQGTRWRRKIAENFNRLSRVHQRHRQTTDRQTTDGTAIAYSEPEHKFTFAKKSELISIILAHLNAVFVMNVSVNSIGLFVEFVTQSDVTCDTQQPGFCFRLLLRKFQHDKMSSRTSVRG